MKRTHASYVLCFGLQGLEANDVHSGLAELTPDLGAEEHGL